MRRLACRIAVEYWKNNELTMDELANNLEEDKVLLGFVIDSYLVTWPEGHEDMTPDQFADNVKVYYVGTGAGGGWVPQPEPTVEDRLRDALEHNVITEQDFTERMTLHSMGYDVRDADALEKLRAGQLANLAEEDQG